MIFINDLRQIKNSIRPLSVSGMTTSAYFSVVEQYKLKDDEISYISKFVYGKIYKALTFTEYSTTFIDEEGYFVELHNNDLYQYFRTPEDFRDDKINKILDKNE